MPDETPPEDEGPFIVRRGPMPDPRRRPGRPSTDPELLAEMGRALRHAYSDLLREPVPEHLAVIIAKLDRTDH